jgi:hypothetical protein
MRHPWQRVLVCLVILAPAIARRGFSEQTSGSPGGSYAAPNAGPGASSAPDLTGNHSAQSSPISLDPRSVQFQRDLKNADAGWQASAPTERLKELAASDGSDWSPRAIRFAEGAWITIFAGVGLLVSLAVGGYVWWSRTQSSQVDGAILLPMQAEPAATADDAGQQDQTPKQRAA